LPRLILTVFILSLVGISAAQVGAGAQTRLGSDLPDAPQPQLASLVSGFSGKVILPSAREALPDRTPVPVPPLAGTRVRLRLTTPLSSKLPNGASFQARLDEPLAATAGTILPQGTLFEGHLETKPARRIMRPGSLFMTFDRLVLPDGNVQQVNLHLVSADSAAVKADFEGMLHPTLSKKRLAIQAGGTALTAKFADDLAELAGGTAVGAGTARLIGAGAATTFLVLQKGREVKLQPGDKLEVEFDRPGTGSSGMKIY
jgi:hypothetical protein